MSDNNISPSDDPSAVRIVGVPTEVANHPALRRIARAVLSIAARELAEEPHQPTGDTTDD